MNYMQSTQSYGGVGQHQIPHTSTVGGGHTNYPHGPGAIGPLSGPPPLSQPPGPPPPGSGGVRLGPSTVTPLHNNGQIPQVSKILYRLCF